jgi:hypothetical protein
MLAVAGPAPLRPTLLAIDSCTRQHANLLVSGQIVSGLVYQIRKSILDGETRSNIWLREVIYFLSFYLVKGAPS